MSDNLYEISLRYKEAAQSGDSVHSAGRLTTDSQINAIISSFPGSEHPAFRYWVCVFLENLENNGAPTDPQILKNVIDKVISCIDKISVFPANEKKVLFESVDFIIVNELETQDDINKIIEWIRIGESLPESQAEPFTFRKVAEMNLSDIITGDVVEFLSANYAKIPTDAEFLYRAKFAKIDIEDIVYPFIGPALEYIENRVFPDGNGPVTQHVEEANRILEILIELAEDEDQKQDIKALHQRVPRFERAPLVENQVVTQVDTEVFLINANTVRKNEFPICAQTIEEKNIHVSVYEGTINNTKPCIVKVYRSINDNTNPPQHAMNEILIYQTLSKKRDPKSNCFLEYFGTYIEKNAVNLVMEKIGRTLEYYIKTKVDEARVAECDENTFVKMAYNLVYSFHLMVGAQIFHQDIKPQNLLIDSGTLNIKIIDFDVSLVKNSNVNTIKTGMMNVQGTEKYFCPQRAEAYKKKVKQTNISPELSDVYSLGLVFYQLLGPRKDFGSREEVLKDLNNFRGVSDETKGLIRDMLNEEPTSRPRFVNILTRLKISEDTIVQKKFSIRSS